MGYEAAALSALNDPTQKQILFQNQEGAAQRRLTRTIATNSFANPDSLASTEYQFFGRLTNSSLNKNQSYLLYYIENEKAKFSTLETPNLVSDGRGYYEVQMGNINTEISSDTIVIPGQLNQNISTSVTLSRAGVYNNLIALYKVDSLTGGIDTNGDKIIDLQPGDAGYVSAALTRAKEPLTGKTLQTPVNLGTSQQQIDLLGLGMYGAVLIPNGTIEGVLSQNPTNDQNRGPVALFSFGAANPDGISHMARLGSSLFGFEDIVGGGDRDYNDMILQLTPSSI